MDQKLADLRLKNEQFNMEIMDLRKENGTLKSKNRILRLENEKYSKEIDELRQENENLKSEISKLRSDAHPLPLNDYQTATAKAKNLRLCSAEETKSPSTWMPWGSEQESQNELPNEEERMEKLADGDSENDENLSESEEKPACETRKAWVKLPFQINFAELHKQQPRQMNVGKSSETRKHEEDVKVPRILNTSLTARKLNPRAQPKESLVSIGIDFGTAFTGYSFGLKGAKQIRQPKWGEEYGFNTPKTPTCILFDEDKTFLKFGYDAIMTYTRQTRKNEAKKQYLFDNFKMELYGKVLHRDSMMTAQSGKKMKAIKVFSESLRFMKDHALDMIGKHTTGKKYSASDATWVLTVPAIWSVAAKQFMREAATEAGLVTESTPERLIIALEPEAASVWCKQLPYEGFMEGDLQEAEALEQTTGTKYMVVDCGGGTIDITVHEVAEEGRLKELHRVSGNSLGGQMVDKNFRSYLRETFSEELFDEFEEKHPSELKKLMYEFSICKRYEGEVLINCPYNLQELARKVQDMEDYFAGNDDADWDSGAILLSGEKLRSLHDDSVRGIERLMGEILEKCNQNITYIFLVGGFALSPYVNSFVKEKFGSKYKMLCPVDADLAVVKGAVTFGLNPNVLQSRI